MAEKQKLYWLGVSFDPDEEHEDMSYLSDQNARIFNFLHRESCVQLDSSQAGNFYTETFQNPDVFGSADIVDVWFEDKARIGFGFLVRDAQGMRDTEPAMRPWFKSVGVTMHVALYEIDLNDAEQRKPRPFGVDEILSLDII